MVKGDFHLGGFSPRKSKKCYLSNRTSFVFGCSVDIGIYILNGASLKQSFLQLHHWIDRLYYIVRKLFNQACFL